MLYDTPGLAPRTNLLYWGPCDFPVSYSNRDTSRNAWNCHSGSFMVDMGILSAIWSIPLANVKWHSDPWPTVTFQPIRLSTNVMTLIPSLTLTDYEWFPWSICNGCDMPAGNAYPSRHLVSYPLWDLLVLQLLRPDSSNLPCLYSTFHLEYPLVLSRFCSILLKVKLKMIFQTSATNFFIVFLYHFYLFCKRSWINQIIGPQDHFSLKCS